MKPFRIEATDRYDVTLAQPATAAGVRFLPRDKHDLTGALLEEIVETSGWEAVVDATPLA